MGMLGNSFEHRIDLFFEPSSLFDIPHTKKDLQTIAEFELRVVFD
jgi:hypothetical protein